MELSVRPRTWESRSRRPEKIRRRSLQLAAFLPLAWLCCKKEAARCAGPVQAFRLLWLPALSHGESKREIPGSRTFAAKFALPLNWLDMPRIIRPTPAIRSTANVKESQKLLRSFAQRWRPPGTGATLPLQLPGVIIYSATAVA